MSVQAIISIALLIALAVFFVFQRIHKSGDPEERVLPPAPEPEPEPEDDPFRREVPKISAITTMNKRDAHRPIAGRGD